MIITFCGHSDFCENKYHEVEFMRILYEKVGDKKTAAAICFKIQAKNINTTPEIRIERGNKSV